MIYIVPYTIHITSDKLGERAMINSEEKKIIRELAKKVADIAQLPVMSQRREMWKKHNGLQDTKPMILVFPEGAWHELIPQSQLKCENSLAREIEWKLLARIYKHEKINDDSVVEKEWHVQKEVTHTGWGVEPAQSVSNNSSGSAWAFDSIIGHTPKVWDKNFKFNNEAWGFDPVIKEPSDLKKIKYPEVIYDEKKSLGDYEIVRDLMGDILDVKSTGKVYIQFALMEFYCFLRGLEQVMFDMYEEPEMLHEAMSILEEGNRRLISQYYDMNLLSLNNNVSYHSSGGVGYSMELPKEGFDGKKVRPCDIWACAESQEMAQVSPQMHHEFVMQYEKRLLEPFGLNGYGCCEALENKLDYVFEMPNMRRISISPWADVAKCAEKLKNRYIFSWKPNPAYLAVSYDPAQIRSYVKSTLESTKENVLEIILKDTHTCENQPERFTEWVKIVRELLSEYK